MGNTQQELIRECPFLEIMIVATQVGIRDLGVIKKSGVEWIIVWGV